MTKVIKLLSPKVDIIFKLLFGDERSIEILVDFLKAVLTLPDDEFAEVMIVDPHLLREYDGDKLGILDVKVKTRTKKVIDIEIQVKIKPHFVERIVFYQSKMVTEQIGAGKDFSKIQRVINIIITDENIIVAYEGGEGKYHHRILPCDVDTGYQFTDIKEINILELKKLPKTDDGSNLWAWMKFLNAESKEELDMLVAERPQTKIGKAVARLEELSKDEKAKMLYESRQMLEWDIKLGQDAARSEGSNVRAVEIATNLLRGGMSIADVSAYTGISYTDAETLSKSI
ncbi:MAG: Rpn family recombination-promoting nuclease/putative transposase [Defluviitaleaceae bacterium]|nr:Rpn family recombination-promoting nuclease/putative transposase [Defluviitaleaceae bacterium]